MRRHVTSMMLVAAMALFGLGVRSVIGLFRTDTRAVAATPTQQRAMVSLPGTVYVAQAGALYRLRGGSFDRFTQEQRGWTQPTVLSDGRVLAVARQAAYSDLAIIDSNGSVAQQLTHDAATGRNAPIVANHWWFYPTVSADGTSIIGAYDSPKNGYMVDLAIWSRPLSGSASPKRWSNPNPYTGGDIMPVPLQSGGLIYVTYAADSKQRITSRIVMTTKPGGTEVPLTGADGDCLWPTLSPDEHWMAMVCTGAQQHAELQIAPFNGTTLGPPRTLVSDRLVSAPVWSPDGTGVAYLAPDTAGSGFQLWWLANATTATTPKPVAVTAGVGLDATSRPAWTGSTQ
jgi:Tol biopolymer transport system component